MKIIVFILYSVLYSSCFDRKGGIKLAVNKKMLKLILEYFKNDINDKIKYIYVGDVDGIENIEFGISNFDPDLISFDFYNDNTIKIEIKNLVGSLKLTYHTKFLWIIPVSTNVEIKIKKLDISFDLKVGGKYDSRNNLIPNIYMDSSSFSSFLDFDYNLDGILNWGWIKSILKNKVSNQLNTQIKSNLIELLNDKIDKIPKKITIDEKRGFYIDYSLISGLEIYNDMILVNSYGLFYNENIEETKNREKYDLTNQLLQYDKEGKNFQVFIGDYALKNMLFTLYKSNFLDFKITPKLLNKTLELETKLNINLISKIYKGLEDIYDKEKEVNITIKVNSLPNIELVKDYIYLYIPTNVKIEIDEDKCILEYNTNIELKGDVEIIENQNITGKIISIFSRNTNITKSNANSLDNQYLEKKFNLFGGIIKAVANFVIYDNIHLELPKYKNINFYDMSVEHENNYIILNYNLKWDINNNSFNYYYILIFVVFISLIIGVSMDKKMLRKKKKDKLLDSSGQELADLK